MDHPPLEMESQTFCKTCNSHTQGRVGTLQIEMAEMTTSRNLPTALNKEARDKTV